MTFVALVLATSLRGTGASICKPVGSSRCITACKNKVRGLTSTANHCFAGASKSNHGEQKYLMHPRVSIVITCFNYGAFVGEAIASALCQSTRPFEVIVVDDASDDTCTRETLKKLEKSGIRLLLNSSRRGVSEARNIGIRSANAPYVITLDADDKLDPRFIEKTLPILHHVRADVVYSNTQFFGGKSGPLELPRYLKRRILKRNIVVSTALFRKASWVAVGGYSSELVHGLEDWDFWLSFVERGAKFHKVQESLFFYRKHGPSRTTAQKKCNSELLDTIRKRHPGLAIGVSLPEKIGNGVCSLLNSAISGFKRVFSKPSNSFLPTFNQSLKVHFFNPPKLNNFGDKLNVPLLRILLGRPVAWANPRDATHVCIGSMLETFHPRFMPALRDSLPVLNVWGTGFIAAEGSHPKLSKLADAFCRPLRVLAVRGELSKSRLAAIGVDVSQTVLGDPGLLTSWIYDSHKSTKRYSVGIIPHYIERDDPRVRELGNSLSESTVIDITGSVENVVQAIRQCDVVLSSSLHGLVIADSYGIPNMHITISGDLTGGSYKFKDYYSALEVSHECRPIESLPRQTKLLLSLVRSTYRTDVELVSKIQQSLFESLANSQ